MSATTRTAIVTGASGGIGRVVAERLARDGFAVVLNYAGKAANADQAVAELRAAGGQALAVKANVADVGEVGQLFKATVEQFGGVSVVVHCAGILPVRTIVEDQDLSLFDQVININLRGSYAVMAESARRMRRGGRIIAFSSSEIAKSFPRYGAYSASKAAVESLVHTLANELRGRDITVNAVAPGPVGTPLFLNGKSQAQIDELSKLAPLERLARPEDIVGAVSFLAGPDGAWVNSQVLRVNGGFVY
jgi:3-oxoacyl-[acyl-carrier protein] reductase